MIGKVDGGRGVKRPLTEGCMGKLIGNEISFYVNARSLRNKFEEVRAYVS